MQDYLYKVRVGFSKQKC